MSSLAELWPEPRVVCQIFRPERVLFVVQTKVVLLFVRAVAFVTTFDKNELNVAGEINRALRCRDRGRLNGLSRPAANGDAKGQRKPQECEPSPEASIC
jgi:hypothetical protein